MSSEPSPRRFALRAAFLVLPLLLAAVALPLVRRHLAAPGGALGEAAGAARAAADAGAARAALADGAAGPAGAAPASPPPRRDRPTTGQIEEARAAAEALARAQRGWQRSETMAPRQAQRAPDGELVAPFQGFGLSVESTPDGAAVQVAGRALGQTPLVASVDCAPGEAVVVRIEQAPLRPEVRTVRCRADALVTVRVKLAR